MALLASGCAVAAEPVQGNTSPTPMKMPANPAAAQADWWKKAVFYEVYPRSFADSDNDGVGDLKGIAGRIDYLRDLGIDAIWLTPMFPSPQVDFGYDVSDFKDVDPQYGTLADLDRLIALGKQNGVKLVLDLVINHTSDQHEWFKQASSARDNPYRDFYIWRDGKAGGPPNNWTSQFGGPAWTGNSKAGQYYYHMYTPEQPDLNLRNPKVEAAMFDIVRWWFDKGVYGFRLDAVDSMFEREDLKDNPELPGKDEYGMPRQERINNYRLPEVHTQLQRLRGQVVDRYPGRVLIGETYAETGKDIARYYGPRNDEIQMPMFLSLIRAKPFAASSLRERIEAVENNPVGGWPTFALDNHDNIRAASRLTPPGHDPDDIAKLTGALLLTLRGTPILYYGQEIGMLNNDPKRVEDVQDPIGRKGWPQEKGRDGERTPMQWDASVNAGFNRGAKPWLPVGDDYRTRNVAAQTSDPSSVLSWYRQLIALRRTHPAFLGDFISVDRTNPSVLAFLRSSPEATVLVLLNLSDKPATVGLAAVEAVRITKPLAVNGASASGSEVSLKPFGAYVAEIARRK
ncbi:glucohydrolase [Sphingomonas oleivorans]|uniref:Glucohydrolase n=2 Tax=Sphingomonas oleivorans TaxID=1735121 RepID=A0A2T5FU65_9SPHN|nr:glucohydrolase [Sphingomonas oleivorans]